MVRVLQVFGILNRGGAETMIMNYYRNINRDNIQFDFVVNFKDEGAYESEIRELGGRIFRMPRFKGYNLLSFVLAWYKLLKEHREWQAIHIHNFKVAGLIFPIAKLLKRGVRVVHMHTANPTYTASRRIGYEMTKALANSYSTRLLACSNEAGECYYGKRKFSVINNAIDVDRFSFDENRRNTIRKEFNFQDNHFVLGHVGNFSAVKNHKFIIEIFSEVYKQDNRARLLLVGDGGLFEEIKELVKSKGLTEVVIFTGSRGDVADLMMAMDSFIFPSHFEGLPVTIVEVQASGLPAFISDVITKEVVVTDLVHTLPLSEGAKAWADRVLQYERSGKRDNFKEQIVASGYDVANNIKQLEQIYL